MHRSAMTLERSCHGSQPDSTGVLLRATWHQREESQKARASEWDWPVWSLSRSLVTCGICPAQLRKEQEDTQGLRLFTSEAQNDKTNLWVSWSSPPYCNSKKFPDPLTTREGEVHTHPGARFSPVASNEDPFLLSGRPLMFCASQLKVLSPKLQEAWNSSVFQVPSVW